MPVRARFKSITTMADPRFAKALPKNINRLLAAAAKDFEKNFGKVTSKFTHANSPEFKTEFNYGKPPGGSFGDSLGRRVPIGMRKFAITGGPGGKALYVMVHTENDPIFYYLDSGARRFRKMSPNYRPLTRSGMGVKTYSRRGKAMGMSTTELKPIEARLFAADVVRRSAPAFLAAVTRFFQNDAVTNVFAETRIRG